MKPDERTFLKKILEEATEIEDISGDYHFSAIIIGKSDAIYKNFLRRLELNPDNIDSWVAVDNDWDWEDAIQDDLEYIEYVIEIPGWQKDKNEEFLEGAYKFLNKFYEL